MSLHKAKWLLSTVILCGFAAPAVAQSAGAVSNASTSENTRNVIETVTVTAEKQKESSLDVPMSLTALSGEKLERTQAYRFEDYVGNVPGLTWMNSWNGAGSSLVIRGITTGAVPTTSPVASYIDETPYNVNGGLAGSFASAPNLDTFDMQRIEVLRGPQGTLYGSNALGGLLKFVTNAPDPTAFSDKLEAGVSSVEHGGVGFDVHGMVNVPLTNDTALRVVAYDNYYPGFIDDPGRNLSHINGSHYTGMRASFLYQPADTFSLRLNALYQVRGWSDAGNEDVNPNTFAPIYCSLCQENVIAQPGHVITQIYNATINWDLGIGNLVSATSESEFDPYFTWDRSKRYGAFVSSIVGSPSGVGNVQNRPLHAITQELRLSSEGDSPLQWMLGGFFTDEVSHYWLYYAAASLSTHTIEAATAPTVGEAMYPSNYREYAGYANVDYHFSPAFDVAVGGRYSRNSQLLHQTTSGKFLGTSDFTRTSSEDTLTYSADARWHVTDEHMLYARVATGFSPGGPANAVPSAPVPPFYKASTTTNYELGVKSSMLDGALITEFDAFTVHWSNIQLFAYINGYGTYANGGTARSDGAEWSVNYTPLSGLTLGFNGSYTDARLTEDTPANVGGKTGDRLPSSPMWETSFSASYEQPLFADYSSFEGVDWHYTGSRMAEFEPTSTRQ
ncbi:MAG: TonB-dependent receptor, partial [Alphaproteobacteria bacterium]|nr:TonB-dependent receptor [Alphaproteobacteria bacterium]